MIMIKNVKKLLQIPLKTYCATLKYFKVTVRIKTLVDKNSVHLILFILVYLKLSDKQHVKRKYYKN